MLTLAWVFLLHFLCPGRAWVLYPGQAITKGMAYEETVNISQIMKLFLDQDGNQINITNRETALEVIPSIFRWEAESSILDTRGLAGGITYAFDPKFCEKMLPNFEEGKDLLKFYEFVDCDFLKDILLRAFNSWQNNNKNLHFIDVTDLCGGDDTSKWSLENEVTCTSQTCYKCDLAEIVVSTFSSGGGDHAHTGARSTRRTSKSNPIQTNAEIGDGGSLRAISFEFASNKCWYVDAEFCTHFFTMAKDGTTDTVLLMVVMMGVLFFLSILCLACLLWSIMKQALVAMFASWDTDGNGVTIMEIITQFDGFCNLFRRILCGCKFETEDGKRIDFFDGLFAIVEAISKIQIFRWCVVFFFMFAPPMFYYKIFQPCWYCYDMEAAAIHEVGHLLGFDHVDEFHNINFKMNLDSYQCNNTESSATLYTDEEELKKATNLMFNYQLHDPRYCVTKDDLDGLNFLYPVCSRRLQEPYCVQIKRHIGLLRVFQGVVGLELFPGLAVFGIKLVAGIIMKFRNKYLAWKKKRVGKKAKKEKKAKKRQVAPTPEAESLNPSSDGGPATEG